MKCVKIYTFEKQYKLKAIAKAYLSTTIFWGGDIEYFIYNDEKIHENTDGQRKVVLSPPNLYKLIYGQTYQFHLCFITLKMYRCVKNFHEDGFK